MGIQVSDTRAGAGHYRSYERLLLGCTPTGVQTTKKGAKKMKYVIEVRAKYNMYVEAEYQNEAIIKADKLFEFLETDYPEDTKDITEIEKVYAYAQVEEL